MRHLKTLALIFCGALVLTACGSSVKLDEQASATDTSSADTRTVSTVDADAQYYGDPLDNPQGILAKRSVYFDFDSYTVGAEYRAVIEAHAKYLVSNPSRKIMIQGNTDERGGREYNLALGQKRAEAVRKQMSILGVSDQQIEAVSYGEEKPKAAGGSEEAYSQNRRADLVY